MFRISPDPDHKLTFRVHNPSAETFRHLDPQIQECAEAIDQTVRAMAEEGYVTALYDEIRRLRIKRDRLIIECSILGQWLTSNTPKAIIDASMSWDQRYVAIRFLTAADATLFKLTYL